jgi:hypothetical protein
MPTTERREQSEDREHDRREALRLEALSAVIAEQVLHCLGEPGDLLRMQVRRLWDNSYRVNVLVGRDAASAKVANSYFVEADNDGNVVKSTPKITHQY